MTGTPNLEAGRSRQRPRLRTILLGINLVILALPLGGITWLRLYESALIRQTESELNAQGAIIASVYQALFAQQSAFAKDRDRSAAFDLATYGQPADPPPLRPGDGPWQPRLALLDLATDPIHPRPPEPTAAAAPADALAVAVGRELTPILRRAQRVTLAGIRVVDWQGTVVASTSEDFGLSLANHDEVGRALRGEPVSLMRSRGSEHAAPLESISRGTGIRVFVAVPILQDGRVLGAILLARTPANIRQAIYGKRKPLLYGALVLLAVVLVLSVLTSRTISRPVQDVIAQARRAARGEQGAVIPLKAPGTREIAELSETVAAMARSMEARANYIRDFAAHVSHEFKTPLTAIQGAVELLRDHAETMSPDERARFLDILARDAQRLEQLVRRLLDLARADMMQPGEEHADVGRVLAGLVERYHALGLPVEIAGGTPQLAVAMAAETLDSVLASLLDNTREHGGGDARVTVQCTLEPVAEPPQVAITVRDDGHGISPANAARVFEPFFTTAREQGHTGLGLSIIRALVVAHRGTVELLPAERGAIFRLRLPQAGAAPAAPAGARP